MRVRTMNGGETDLGAEALDGLAARVRGPVLRPGAPGYDDSRTVWNGMIDRRPAAVVRCLGAADVQRCVEFARERDLLLCVKGGGHNIAGLATADGALQLDMSLMRGVWVDRKARVARAQAGCLLGDVDRETQAHGLAAVLGIVSATGIAGLTLGGGFGYLTRRFGWTTDNVRGMDVVTADGRLVRASAEENPDLFWGLRGGGGNFGVVTGIDYDLHAVGPEVVGGLLVWPAREAPRVLERFRAVTESAPPELTLGILLRKAPPAPWIPTDLHGQPIVGILACHTGPVAEAERALDALRSPIRPSADVVARRPYAEMQSLLDATQPKGRRYYWKSEYLPRVDPALCDRYLAHGARITSPHSAAILFHVGGALNRLPDDHSAVGNRSARYALILEGAWDAASDDARQVAWARDAWSDMRSFSTGGTYLNFLTEDDGADRTAAALGGNFQKLARIKAAWDPRNVFRTNRNIAPA